VLVIYPLGAGPWITVNSDTGSNYSYVYMVGNGSSTYSGQNSAAGQFRSGVFAGGAEAQYTVQFFDYSATDKHKSILSRADKASFATEASAQRWVNTVAITSLQVYGASGGTFTAGSTFALYGIAA
jgi:hypothetical protein